ADLGIPGLERGPQRGQGLAAETSQRLRGFALGVARRAELLHERGRVARRFCRLPQDKEDDQCCDIHRRFSSVISNPARRAIPQLYIALDLCTRWRRSTQPRMCAGFLQRPALATSWSRRTEPGYYIDLGRGCAIDLGGSK